MKFSHCTVSTALGVHWHKAVMQIMTALSLRLRRETKWNNRTLARMCSWKYCGCKWAALVITYIMGAQIFQKSGRNLKRLLPDM